MVKKRYITVLTFQDGVLFRTKSFTPDYRYTQKFVDAWSIDEVILLDVTRAGTGNRENFYEVISDFAKKCFVPVTVGGGVRSLKDFEKYLSLGADKIAVNTGAFENNSLITEAAKLYGAQCVVVSIDALKNERGTYEVFTHFGSQVTGVSVTDWAKKAETLGAGEILISSIERDGSLEGYDNELNKLVSSSVKIPVLGVGGAGKWQDLVDGFTEGGLSAACTTCIYHFTDTSIKSAKQFLKKAGVDGRF